MYFLKNFIKKIIPVFFIDWYHFILSFLGALIYGFPSRRFKVIGVTGTNGKSTVVNLTARILEGAGFKTASISSVRFKIGEREWQNELKMTMPGRFKIQQFLRQAVDAGCKYAVLEVTSEGIKQYRHRFIDFNTAVLTNITPEHIESHGSFEKYKQAKSELFKITKGMHILNLDDKSAEEFLQFEAESKYGFRIRNYESRIKDKNFKTLKFVEAEDTQLMANGSNFNIQDLNFKINLLGEFNIYNTLTAICVGLSQNISLEKMRDILKSEKGVPGRMEIVVSKPFTVIVDYAHTPDALEKVYQTVKKIKLPEAKIIGVLGAAGGGRDKWKRPEMGKLAALFCDYIILTNEDPYDENPNQILSEIKSGITNNQETIINLYEILDRRGAIEKALSLAKAGDIVIITGKGNEPWMCIEDGKKISWDDRQIVKGLT